MLMDDFRRFCAGKVEKFLETPGGLLRYCDMGRGEPFVVIHGLTGTYDYYFYTIEHFAADHRVIGYNYRGDPNQDESDGRYEHDDLVDDLARLLDHLGIGRAIIFGSSFGGTIALRFADKYADRCAHLLLHSTFARYDLSKVLRRLIWAFDKLPFNRVPFRQFARIFRRAGMMDERTPEEARFTERQFYSTPYRTLIRRLHFIRDLNLVPMLPRIRARTFLIRGDEDVVVTEAHNSVVIDNLPGIADTVLQGSGHGCFISRRDRFNLAMRRFLAGEPVAPRL
ncbi:MAG: alpha/beta hydrolase [Planctomycetes bacterium]|nr:alpha/beta hydrolase [Planctomycetota bacterium]